MPNWLKPLLSWGGLALAVVAAIALIYVETLAPTAEEGGTASETTAPIELYWVLLVAGIVAAAIGFYMGRRKAGGEAKG